MAGKGNVGKIAAALVALLLLGVMASGALADGDPFSATTSADTTSASSTSSDTTGASTDPTTTTDAATTDGTTTDSSTDTTGASTDATTTTDPSTAPTTPPSLLSPTVVTDQADYAPGSTVTLIGSGWGAGESVHLVVNDSLGQTWQYEADVDADLTGGFVVQFQLASYFISNYDVMAVGSGGEEATAAFTDAASLTLAGTSGASGGVNSAVSVNSGGGPFSGVQSDIGIYWDGTLGATTGTLVTTCSSNNGGNIPAGSCTFNVPATASVGLHTVAATDKSTHESVTATFNVTNSAANAPTALAQFQSDATTSISVGGTATATTVVLKATVSDPDSDQTRLQVEVKPIGTAFASTATATSSAVTSGGTATATVSGLASGTSYHWQARAIDANNAAGSWVSFGGNAESAADFTVQTQQATALSAISGSGTFGGAATLTATLKAGATPLNGKTVAFTLNGTAICGGSTGVTCPTTSASGVASLGNISLTGINAGTYATAIGASFAGDSGNQASSGFGPLTVNQAAQATLSITAPASATFGDPDATITTSGGSGTGAVSFNAGASTACSIVSGKLHVTSGAGTCSLTATKAADTNFLGATSAAFPVTIDKAAQATLSITAPSSMTFGDADATITTSGGTGTGALTFDAGTSTACSIAAGKLHVVSGTGSCSITAAKASDNNYNSATSAAFPVSISKAQPDCSSISGYSATFDGGSHTATGACKALDGSTLAGLDLSGTTHTNAGTYDGDGWSFPGTSNYASKSGSVNDQIDLASSTTTVTCDVGPFVYDGSAQTPCHVSVTGASGLSLTPTPNYSDNTNAGTATASYTYAGDANHKPSTDSKTFTIGTAPSTTAVVCPDSIVYDGASQEPCTVSVLGAGDLNLTPDPTYSDNTDAGTATASYTYAGDGNHDGSSDSKTFTIEKADSATAVVCPASPLTYDGLAQEPCAASVVGAGGLSKGLTVDYTNNVDAGTAHASASYGGDDNHIGSSDSKGFTIGKADVSVSISWSGSTYDGDPNAATAEVVGPVTFDNPIHNPAVTFEYFTGATAGAAGTGSASAPVDAGTYSVRASFAGNDNYNGNSSTESVEIAKAGSVTKVTCDAGPFVYDGSPQVPCHVLVTGAGRLSLAPAPDYSDNTNAGTATASYTYPGDANHDGSSNSKTFAIDKADSTTHASWSGWTYDGSAHAASAGVSGAVTADNPITTPAVTFDYFVGSVAGATGTGSATAPTNAGTYSVRASFAGNGNYKPSSETATVTVDKANSTTKASWTGWTYDGTAHAASAGVTGSVAAENPINSPAVTFEYFNGSTAGMPGTGSATAPKNAGPYTVRASFPGNGNYYGSSDTVTVTVAQATPLVQATWAGWTTYDGNAHAATGSVSGVGTPPESLGDADAFVYYSGSAASGTPLLGAPSDAGTYTVVAHYNGSANYTTADSAPQTVTVAKAASTTQVTCPTSVTYTATAQMPCTAAATGAGGLNKPLSPSYLNNTGVGTATANASYAGDNNHSNSSGSKTFAIVYGAAEVQFLQPINGTAHNLSTDPDVSTFKAGSTVPVKVQIKLPNGTIVHPASAVWLTPANAGATSQGVDETVSTDAPSSGPSYGWDSSGLFYQYNWGTSKSGAGAYWLIGVKFDDGQVYTVYISLR